MPPSPTREYFRSIEAPHPSLQNFQFSWYFPSKSLDLETLASLKLWVTLGYEYFLEKIPDLAFRSQFLVLTYVTSKFTSNNQCISISKCLWNCREFKLHTLFKVWSAKALRSIVIGEQVFCIFSKKCMEQPSLCPTQGQKHGSQKFKILQLHQKSNPKILYLL